MLKKTDPEKLAEVKETKATMKKVEAEQRKMKAAVKKGLKKDEFYEYKDYLAEDGKKGKVKVTEKEK